MGGWHLRMIWGQEVYYTSLNSEPASALSLPTVWSHRAGVARCQEMATLPAGYIPQIKMASASIVFVQCCRMVDSIPRWQLSLCIRANKVRPTVDHKPDDTPYGARTFSWQDSVHSWKAGPLTVEKKVIRRPMMGKIWSTYLKNDPLLWQKGCQQQHWTLQPYML